MTAKPIDALLKRADDIMEGKAMSVEDWRDALTMYQSAANMGSVAALRRIGLMFTGKYGVNGPKPHRERALEYFKKGASLWDVQAFYPLVNTYLEGGEEQSALRAFIVLCQHLSAQSEWAEVDSGILLSCLSVLLQSGVTPPANEIRPVAHHLMQSIERAMDINLELRLMWSELVVQWSDEMQFIMRCAPGRELDDAMLRRMVGKLELLEQYVRR